MKDVTDLVVTQFRVFPPNSIPLPRLKTRTQLEALKDRFAFVRTGVDPETGDILAEGGEFGAEDGKRIALEAVHIAERRTVIEVLGNSAEADQFHELLLAHLRDSVTDDLVIPKPVVKTDQSVCVVTLEVDALELYAKPVRHFLQDIVPSRLSTEDADATLRLVRFTAALRFKEKRQEIKEHRISLADKRLTIEPRAGSPMSDRRYYTSSPTDSDTHLALVCEFEKLIAQDS